MEVDLIDFNLPENDQSIITVIGVGGGGNNAVNRMHSKGIKDVAFLVTNTDAQALATSEVPVKIQLGETLTEGRGAGNRAATGEKAAIESADKIRDCIKPSAKMAFIVAGMGGGTGTGATPVIARICRDLNILTVAVVTLPFRFEGPLRMEQAMKGIETLKKEVDALLIIHNEKLREIYGNLTLSNAFANADNVLMLAVKGIAEIITIHGYVNVDFADVFSVMSEGGIAFMGSASASGPDRAKEVIESTINSPLLNNNDLKGARKVLLNITSGTDEITVDEIGTITDKIIENVRGKVNTIWGTCTDESLGDEIRITLVATGFTEENIPEYMNQNPPEKKIVELHDKKTDLLFPEIEVVENHEDKEKNKEQKEQIENKEREEQEEQKEVKRITNNDQIESDETEGVSDVLDFIIGDKPEGVNGKIEDVINEKPAMDLEMDELKSLERRNSARLKAFNYNNFYDPENIEQIEKIPAYKRRKEPVQSEIFPVGESESRYTLGRKGTMLSANNPHLHDNVD